MTSERESTDVVDSPYSPRDEDEPLITIVETVAEAKGVDSIDLYPLQSVINIDSLNLLMRADRGEFLRSASGGRGGDPVVTFRYEGCSVTVDPDTVSVTVD